MATLFSIRMPANREADSFDRRTPIARTKETCEPRRSSTITSLPAKHKGNANASEKKRIHPYLFSNLIQPDLKAGVKPSGHGAEEERRQKQALESFSKEYAAASWER
jgi:hypothetical protein